MSSKKRSSRSSSSKAKDSASGWEYPDYYNNPPFFTLQPVAETRQRQLSMWIDLIRDYCKAHKVFIMDPGHPIFNNSGIKSKSPMFKKREEERTATNKKKAREKVLVVILP